MYQRKQLNQHATTFPPFLFFIFLVSKSATYDELKTKKNIWNFCGAIISKFYFLKKLKGKKRTLWSEILMHVKRYDAWKMKYMYACDNLYMNVVHYARRYENAKKLRIWKLHTRYHGIISVWVMTKCRSMQLTTTTKKKLSTR